MTDSAALERSYRRMLACYPRSFRRDNEDEMLTVLMAAAEDGQRRIGLAEAADLIRGAVRMRLWPAAPRPGSVRAAVRLMLAGAAAELAQSGDKSVAVIASELAARIYGLKILKRDVEDARHNTTRFLVMSREARRAPRGRPASAPWAIDSLTFHI